MTTGGPQSGLATTPRPPDLSLVHRLAPFKRSLVLMTGCLLVQTVYWIATPLLLAHLVDEGLLRNDRSVLSQVVATLVVITVLGEAAGVAFDRLSARVLAELLRRLRQDMFDQLQRLSLRYYARNSEGDIVARFSADVTVVEELLASFVPWVVMPGLAVAGSTVALFALDWRLALLAMLVWPSSLTRDRGAADRHVVRRVRLAASPHPLHERARRPLIEGRHRRAPDRRVGVERGARVRRCADHRPGHGVPGAVPHARHQRRLHDAVLAEDDPLERRVAPHRLAAA